MEKIIVIGSNSFSGSAFVKHALENDFEVIGTSRSDEPNAVFLPYRWLDSKKLQKFKFVKADLNQDMENLLNLINKEKPKYVVNFAAQSMVAESWLYPEDWMRTNILSNVKLHEHLRKCDFLEKYIHISTPEVYGSCEGLVQTNANFKPSTPYAVSRAAADMWLSALNKTYQFPVVFTRAANVYGPGQQLYRIIPKTILNIKLGKKLPLHGGGHSVRSFIHIQDVADGTLRALSSAKAGEVFHFSTKQNIAIRDLVKMICERMKVNFDEVVSITEDRPGKDSAYLLDSSDSYSKLSWQDKIDLETGIDQTISWVEQNLDYLKTTPLEYQHKA